MTEKLEEVNRLDVSYCPLQLATRDRAVSGVLLKKGFNDKSIPSCTAWPKRYSNLIDNFRCQTHIEAVESRTLSLQKALQHVVYEFFLVVRAGRSAGRNWNSWKDEKHEAILPLELPCLGLQPW